MVKRPYACRVAKDDDGWWVTEVGPDHSTDVTRYDSVGEMPEPISTHVSVLLMAPDNYNDPRIGRRISSDRFWVYYVEIEQSEPE